MEVEEAYCVGERQSMPKAKAKGLTGRGARDGPRHHLDRDERRRGHRRRTPHRTLQNTAGPVATALATGPAANPTMPFSHETERHSLEESVGEGKAAPRRGRVGRGAPKCGATNQSIAICQHTASILPADC